MASASELLQRLDSLGVNVVVEGSEIVLRPGNRVPADLIPELRAAKPGLLSWLSPLAHYGKQAAADAAILSGVLHEYPCHGLDETRRLCVERGLPEDRFPLACIALPPHDSPADLAKPA